MIKLDEVVIVEGKYDKIKLSNIIDGLIITTSGFGIYNNAQLRHYISELASINGVIILTDSDSSGLKIRNYIKSFVPSEKITNIYIPEVLGKEKRKSRHSTENKLGVEGMDDGVLEELFRKAGFGEKSEEKTAFLSKTELYRIGLSGKTNSRENRKKLLKTMNLPENLSSNELIDFVNHTMTKSSFYQVCIDLGLIDNVNGLL